MSRSTTVFRQEALSALRWLSRGSGLTLALAFVLLAALEIVTTIYSGRLQGLRYGMVLNLAIALELSAVTFAAVAWIYFFWLRTLGFLRPARLPDLFVTSLSQNDLFPALLVGPLILALVFAGAWELLVLTIPPLMGEKYYLLHLYLRQAETMSPENLQWVGWMTWLRVPFLILQAGALSLAYSAVAAFVMLPRGGALRLVLVLVMLQLILVPEIQFSFWVDDGAVMTGSVGERNQLICDHILGPAMTILLSFALYFAALRFLRGNPFWNRLRLEAAKA